MKKDILKRVLCLVCCLSLTLGVFAYRPTKAEAVFVSPAAALGASLIATVIVATTAQFFVSSGAADAIGEAVDGFVTKFISSAPDYAHYTTDAFFGEIAEGAALLETGAIQLSSAAGELTAKFINWLRGTSYVVPGETGAGYLTNYSFAFGDGFLASYNEDTGVFTPGNIFVEAVDLKTNVPLVMTAFGDGAYIQIMKNGAGLIRTTLHSPSGTELDYIGDWESSIDAYNVERLYLGVNSPGNLSVVLCFVDSSGSCTYRHSLYNFSEFPSYSPAGSANVALESYDSLQTIPATIPVGSAMVVNPAVLDFALDDQQEAADILFDAICAGTLSPTVAVEAEATDVPGTDTDEEEDVIAVPGADADLLDWTKYIGQKVAAIPKAIADAIAGSIASALSAVFAPDPILVNDITGAFSSKFGFVEDLKKIGDDFFGMSAGDPPEVWIHLERAEGKYLYGGTVKALDMSWFQRYKADTDRILGGFLWVAYLWLLFRRLPDILGGAGLVVAEGQYIGEGAYVDGNTGEITGKFMYRRSKRL